jgi:hypothetical protein
MTPPTLRLLRRAAAIAALATVPLVLTAPAAAQAPPAPGNLIVNWSFDADTAGWGSFGGTLARTLNGSMCPTGIPGTATATRTTGDVYTISDSQGSGNLPTVRSTVAGETFIAYATVSAASASAVGKPGRIILRERVGAFGRVLRETAASFSLPPLGQTVKPVVSATATTSGATMGLRIEQSAAAAGDAFTADDIFLRRATRDFGRATPGTVWTTMSSDVARLSVFPAPDSPSGNYDDGMQRYLDRLRVYLDGKGGATGSQRLRALVYYAGFAAALPWSQLWYVSREVTISRGAAARWVDFRFDGPVFLAAADGATYQFGLLSGPTRNVARYASTPQPGALRWMADRYADGPNAIFGTRGVEEEDQPWTADDKQMSIQGIAVPISDGGPWSCP